MPGVTWQRFFFFWEGWGMEGGIPPLHSFSSVWEMLQQRRAKVGRAQDSHLSQPGDSAYQGESAKAFSGNVCHLNLECQQSPGHCSESPVSAQFILPPSQVQNQQHFSYRDQLVG